MSEYAPIRKVTSSSRDGASQSRVSAAKKVACPKIEISDEMVSAGVEVLWASGAVEGQLDSDELLVAEIFEAMLRSASKS